MTSPFSQLQQHQQQQSQVDPESLQFPLEFQQYIDDLESLVKYTPRDVQLHHGTASGQSNVLLDNRDYSGRSDQNGIKPSADSILNYGNGHGLAAGSNLANESRDHCTTATTTTTTTNSSSRSEWNEIDESDRGSDAMYSGRKRKRPLGMSATSSSVAHVYLKLPPPRLPIIPLLERDTAEMTDSDDDDERSTSMSEHTLANVKMKTYDVSSEEDFVALKHRVDKYLNSVESHMQHVFRYMDAGEDVVYHQLVRETQSDDKGKSNSRRKVSNRPTIVILKNALDAADDLLQEIDRSYQETVLKRQHNTVS